MNWIDAHIHLDKYEENEREIVFAELVNQAGAAIAVSMNEASCEENLGFARKYPNHVFPAFGYHPELDLPSEEELERLFAWIERHHDAMIAVGEVGLPYYNRTDRESKGEAFDLDPYIGILDRFVELAVRLDKPIVLHAVYEDADIVCELLEKHGCTRAHFHWFKGSEKTIERMARNGYSISISPDVCYEEEIRKLASLYPIDLIMAETDGPWPHEGPFAGRMTTPGMSRRVAEEIAPLRGLTADSVRERIFKNTVSFYRLK